MHSLSSQMTKVGLSVSIIVLEILLKVERNRGEKGMTCNRAVSLDTLLDTVASPFGGRTMNAA